MRRRMAITVALTALCFVAQHAAMAQGLFSESDREYYRGLLAERRARYPQLETTVFSAMESARMFEEKDALLFLLSTSPLADLADNSGSFFLSAVRAALETRREMPWGKSIPDPVFLHFVLPLRTGSEAIDSSRLLFPGILRQRVQGLGMREAVLEVNHWCHEHVTYAPSDARTRAPLATMRNAKGRCGEESVFTTTALRAAGIPARQVYVPRWAHADDNHAWVEAWVDGAWHFIGACEPDVDLDRAWFTGPARRAMLTAALTQGRYWGTDDILVASRLYTRINTLPVYAPTRVVTVQVLDENGAPITDARVDFRLYNYAEFYPVASIRTDGFGSASLRTGHGDLLVWAHLDKRHAFAVYYRERADTLRLVLGEIVRTEGRIAFDLVPPAEVKLPQEEHPRAALTAARLHRGDSLRGQYEAVFLDSAGTAAFALEHGYPADSCWMLLHVARGNGTNILAFLSDAAAIDRVPALAFLRTLMEKDLQDAPASVLLAHYTSALAHRAEGRDCDSEYIEYVCNPRIGHEELRPWREPLIRAVAEHPVLGAVGADEMRARVISAWVRDSIRLDHASNWGGVPLPVLQTFSLRGGDTHSRDMLFVALCRAAGIPSRLNPASGAAEFLSSGRWYNAGLESEEIKPIDSAELLLRPREGQRLQSPEYARHFTIARFDEGVYHTLDYEGDERFGSWPVRLRLQPGAYMIVTGNRQPDGSVLAALDFLVLGEGVIAEHELYIRDDDSRPVPLGSIAPELLQQEPHSAATSPKGDARAFVLLWIERGTEPVSHALLDIAREKEALHRHPVTILLSGHAMNRTELETVAKQSLPQRTIVCADGNEELRDALASELHLPAGFELPLIAICDADGEITFAATGYTIGVGTQILRILERMHLTE